MQPPLHLRSGQYGCVGLAIAGKKMAQYMLSTMILPMHPLLMMGMCAQENLYERILKMEPLR